MNHSNERKELWDSIKEIADNVKGAWVLSGDFNCPLKLEDKIGSPLQSNEIMPFAECVEYCGVANMCQIGCQYTWNNK